MLCGIRLVPPMQCNSNAFHLLHKDHLNQTELVGALKTWWYLLLPPPPQYFLIKSKTKTSLENWKQWRATKIVSSTFRMPFLSFCHDYLLPLSVSSVLMDIKMKWAESERRRKSRHPLKFEERSLSNPSWLPVWRISRCDSQDSRWSINEGQLEIWRKTCMMTKESTPTIWLKPVDESHEERMPSKKNTFQLLVKTEFIFYHWFVCM